MMNKNILLQETLPSCIKLQHLPYDTGKVKENFPLSELKEDIEDISYQTSLNCSNPNHLENQLIYLKKEESAIAECRLMDKKKTWNLKSNSLNEHILTTKLLEILEVESTLKEKVLTPFWTLQSKVISQKLWLPTEIDSVDSVLISSNESSKNTQMGKSWFSIKKKHPQNKNLLMTSFQLSQFSLPGYMDQEVTLSKTKSKISSLKKKKNPTTMKTLKLRLFPTKQEQEELQLRLSQFRWYYNATVNIINNKYSEEELLKQKEWSNTKIRDLIRKYEYVEYTDENSQIKKDFIYDENRNEIPIPSWWSEVHNRIPRGASDKFTSSLNSAISNLRAGNISKFKMSFKTKKDPTYYMHFEDKAFPSFIRKIKSNYWYTTKDRKRKHINLETIFKERPRGIEIIYEKETNKYFLHYPIESDWFPNDDKRIEKQETYNHCSDRIISLDPGIRKFLVGYDPSGESIFIGEKASLELSRLLLLTDKYKNNYCLWKKIKDLVSELHWKTISFLISNYDIIILPDFKVSQMLKKNNLSPMTKRLMSMFSFFNFKQKLQYKCQLYNKKLIIVDESYTSCTCGQCGEINKGIKGNETFICSHCHIKMDRDASAARNILIKNVKINPHARGKFMII